MTYPGPVTNDEDITRFVTSSRQIKNGERVHHGALWPDENEDYTTSVYRITELNTNEVWALADKEVDVQVLARTTLKVQIVRDNTLDIDPDDVPPRHANIINWPQDRKQYRNVAQKLAAKAKHLVR